MIHYHGTPISPRRHLERMAGRHFCVSFAAPQDLRTCLRIGQSVLLDNGAYSVYTRGIKFDEKGYYKWLDPILAPPHWAVVPDVIKGDEKAQRAMVARWRFGRNLGAPVWHLGLSLNYLYKLTDEWPRVCLGSSAEYWQVGSPHWARRMDQVFDALAKRHQRLPWLHGLRMLSQTTRWPLSSADSVNVGRNFKTVGTCAECMAMRIDAKQPKARWRSPGGLFKEFQ